ncbi:MAG: restriction endonuclease subunit S [Ruminococcus sp.]|nr:restriction endonuclease subunit S [Ruminococcus sp.]
MNKFSDYFEAQKKSKIKAGDGLVFGKYKFFNSSNMQTKFYNQALYHSEALIFGTGGNASIHYCNEPFSTSTDCIVFFAKRNDFSVKLVYQYLSGNIHILQNGFKGAGIKHISKGYIEEIELNLPILEQQHQIASIFDKVTCTIELCNQIIEKLDLLVKAKFVEMFGDAINNSMKWHTVCITDVCKAIYGGGTPSKSHPEYFTGDIVWISPKDMKSEIISDSIDHITYEAVENSSVKFIPSESVLMVIRSGILKHTLPIAINSVPVTINQDMKAFVPNDKIIVKFMLHYFKSIESDILQRVRAVTADNIDFKDFQKRKIILPPLELQQKFADFAEQTEKSKSAVKRVLEKAETLKKALMQKYFG